MNLDKPSALLNVFFGHSLLLNAKITESFINKFLFKSSKHLSPLFPQQTASAVCRGLFF